MFKFKMFFNVIFLFSFSFLQAQVDPAILVTIHSVNTTIDMNAVTPTAGSLIYNVERKSIYFYDGSAWVELGLEANTPGSVLFAGADGSASEDNVNLYFNNTTNRLGVGTNTPSEELEVVGDISVTGRYKDSSGSFGSAGEVLTVNASENGTDWSFSTTVPTPFLENTVLIGLNKTATLYFEGANFIPTTTINLVNFSGTVNSISVLSPVKIAVNVTANGGEGEYDVILSNNGVLNTLWPGNGVKQFIVSNEVGTTKLLAALSCKAILDEGFSEGDGLYWVNPDGGSKDNAFQVYCDMTTDGGGWTRIPYASNLNHERHFAGGDGSRWLTQDFSLVLTDQQINDIRSQSTEGKQTYVGTCDGVIHYEYSGSYSYAFGFRFHTGVETNSGYATYPGTAINVVSDGCRTNNSSSTNTIFEVSDVRVPLINVKSRDNGDSGEMFGSPLLANPAWLR